jgi:hypothetical protein
MQDLDTGEEIKGGKATVTKDGKDTIITNSLVIKHELKIVVPSFIRKVMNGLNDVFKTSEFSIFCKTNWNADAEAFVIEEEYYIPQQEVSTAHIDYKEDPGLQFNTVLHRHPAGCANFSGTDERYINANFRFSLLWTDRSIVKAIATLPVGNYGFFARLKLTPADEGLLSTTDIVGSNKITERTMQPIRGSWGERYAFSNQFGWVDSQEEMDLISRYAMMGQCNGSIDPHMELSGGYTRERERSPKRQSIFKHLNGKRQTGRVLDADDEYEEEEEFVQEEDDDQFDFNIGARELGCELESDDCGISLGQFEDGERLEDD